MSKMWLHVFLVTCWLSVSFLALVEAKIIDVGRNLNDNVNDILIQPNFTLAEDLCIELLDKASNDERKISFGGYQDFVKLTAGVAELDLSNFSFEKEIALYAYFNFAKCSPGHVCFGPDAAVDLEILTSAARTRLCKNIESWIQSGLDDMTIPPSSNPTQSLVPSALPSKNPTTKPPPTQTKSPTEEPTKVPTISTSRAPTKFPSQLPSNPPSSDFSEIPSSAPTTYPSSSPSNPPSLAKTDTPSIQLSNAPSIVASKLPTITLSEIPSSAPSISPSKQPTVAPTSFPTLNGEVVSVPYAFSLSYNSSEESLEQINKLLEGLKKASKHVVEKSLVCDDNRLRILEVKKPIIGETKNSGLIFDRNYLNNQFLRRVQETPPCGDYRIGVDFKDTIFGPCLSLPPDSEIKCVNIESLISVGREEEFSDSDEKAMRSYVTTTMTNSIKSGELIKLMYEFTEQEGR